MSDTKNELTEQEADLYDRQIRLWGIESQKKLRVADILLIGVCSLGAEIAKNVLLSGIKSLTFLDDGIVTKDDLFTNFLLPRASLNKNRAESVLERAKNLNPMVNITSDSSKVDEKDESFYKKFTLVIVTNLTTGQLISISQICRKNSIQFICGDVFGLFGYMFSDLQNHEYCEEIKQFIPNKKRKIDGKIEKVEHKIVKVAKNATFVSFQAVLDYDWSVIEQKKINKICPWYFLFKVLLKFRDTYKRNPMFEEKETDIEKLIEIRDKIFKNIGFNSEKLPDSTFDVIFGEVVPLSAILGGVIAQEVIKAVSHNEAPINNMFFIDPNNFSGKIENIGS